MATTTTTTSTTTTTIDKYDRQLRLWGPSGQLALSETCLVLLRVTAAGTETLKNLVLPGIGAFMIVDVDDNTNNDDDNDNDYYTSNFFLTAQNQQNNDDNSTTTTTKKSRAQMAMEYLQELNSDVHGSFHNIVISSSKDGSSSGGGGDDDDAGLLQFVQSSNNNSSNSNSGLVSLIQDQILNNKKSLQDERNNNKIKNILVVGSDLTPNSLLATSHICQKYGWSFITVHSYGLLGIVRLQVSNVMPLYNPKRTCPPDLRLTTLCNDTATAVSASSATASSQSLQRHMQDLYHDVIGGNDDDNDDDDGWDKLTSQQHGHVPYPFILMKIQKQWLQTHNNKLPSSFAEKQTFQEMIQQASRDFAMELNFQEAHCNAYLAYNTNDTVDAEHLQRLIKILQQESHTKNGNSSSSSSSSSSSQNKFLIMLQALQEFTTLHHGQAPLQGTIPDMTASTDLYVQLQSIYHNQAKSDLDEMRRIIMTMTSTNNNNNNISDEELSTFCQNVQFLDIFQTRTLCQEYDTTNDDHVYKDIGSDDDFDELCQDLSMACMEVASGEEEEEERPDMLPLFWYLGFRACQLFHQRHGRYPGTIVDVDNDDDKKYLQDVPLLQTSLEKVVQAYKLQDVPIVKKVLLLKDGDSDIYKVSTELTRYAQAEIHTIASVVGGVASQEAVKLITGQYVPLNHTYVYNGIASTGGVYKF